MSTSPIILFVYNRPEHSLQTLDALASNDLANQSPLYIYSDGPKYGALEEDLQKIAEVRKIIHSRQWCKDVTIIESERNKGLADSIVSGVTEVVNHYGRVIVLEDDIVTQRGFLRFMNDALDLYADDGRVMHISGMVFGTPKRFKEQTAFINILSCNGWATWKRAWDHYEHDVDLLFKRIKEQNISRRKFNIEGNAHFYEQLVANQGGRLYTWAVRWYASWLTAGGYSLFPHRSLLTNIGHDGTGVHSPAPFYNGKTVDAIKIEKIPVKEDKALRRELDNIWKRGRKQPFSLSKIKKSTKSVLLKCGLGFIRSIGRRITCFFYPELRIFENPGTDLSAITSTVKNSSISRSAKLYPPYRIHDCQIGDYSYVAYGSRINQTTIGKFCSIGPNFHCGWGIHPIDGISTSPMFYSTAKQNGITLSKINKVQERKPIFIGNDVFIGMNVTVLDGVKIGDGAVIGAGCVVSKDIPSYAIAVGNPIRILKYRFPSEVREKFAGIKWWDFPHKRLSDVEEYFFKVRQFMDLYK